jgi:hypothetical protein
VPKDASAFSLLFFSVGDAKLTAMLADKPGRPQWVCIAGDKRNMRIRPVAIGAGGLEPPTVSAHNLWDFF